MTAKVFLTGASGYIGGDALQLLHKLHSDFEFALLVRSEDKANKILAKYPAARIVLGGLDDAATLEREASRADIVIRMIAGSIPPPNCCSYSLQIQRTRPTT